MDKLLRIAPAAALQERRLADKLASGAITAEELRSAQDAAWASGVAAVLGLPAEATARLSAARAAVAPAAAPGPEAVDAWGVALGLGARRTSPLAGGAPPEFVSGRLADLADWLGSGGLAEVRPLARAALAFARVQDVAPLAAGNDQLAHVVLAHVLGGLGLRLPLFDASDAGPLAAAREAAGRFDFGPLGLVLESATGRMLAEAARVGSPPAEA